MTFSGVTKESSTCFLSTPTRVIETLLIPPCPSLAGCHRLLPLLFDNLTAQPATQQCCLAQSALAKACKTSNAATHNASDNKNFASSSHRHFHSCECQSHGPFPPPLLRLGNIAHVDRGRTLLFFMYTVHYAV